MSGPDKRFRLILAAAVATILAGAGLVNGLATAAVGRCMPAVTTTGGPARGVSVGSLTPTAYPDANVKYAATAQAVVAQSSTRQGITVDSCIAAGAAGWVQPVHAGIVSGFRTVARPGHDGVDLGAARGTTVVAAAAGTVIRVRCDIAPSWWGCDRDGSPTKTLGCGHYVDIDHGGGIITRYCHLLAQPTVQIGQTVSVGQPIGLVGSSGHSSGPHLHFEVHLNGDRSPDGAINPVPFMTARGAPLGH